MASGGGPVGTITKGVFGTGDSHQSCVARGVLARNLVSGMKVGTSGGSALWVLVAGHSGPQFYLRVKLLSAKCCLW